MVHAAPSINDHGCRRRHPAPPRSRLLELEPAGGGMDRVARISGHIISSSAGTAATTTQSPLGRPLAKLPPSSRSEIPEHARGTFWSDIEVHGLAKPTFPRLEESLCDVDCAVVGAGIVGLKLARYLARYGLSVVVLEGATVGDNAASARNQGCLQHVVSDYATAGSDAKPLEELGKENRRLIAEQVTEFGIECDWLETAENYMVCRDSPDASEQLAGMRAEVAARQADGLSCRFLEAEEATELGAGGTQNGLYIGGLQHFGDMAATFHSGKYLFGLAKGVGATPGVALYENSRVIEIEELGHGGRDGGVRLVTASGHSVQARHGIIATNACVPQFAPWLADALRAERGQMAVTEPLLERPCVGCGGCSGVPGEGDEDIVPTAWKDIPEPDGRWRLMVTGCRWREHPTNDSIFPQFSSSSKRGVGYQQYAPAPHPRLESEGMAPSRNHQARIDRMFARVFPHLAAAGVKFEYRWGGLQCFTADHHPLCGSITASGRLHTLAGLSGRGNGFSDVLGMFLAGRVAGEISAVEAKWGAEFLDRLFGPDRPSARYGSGVTVWSSGVEKQHPGGNNTAAIGDDYWGEWGTGAKR